jgi:ACR3 family arsenite efflux pump ArsB
VRYHTDFLAMRWLIIEVPVMLSVVRIVNRSRDWYDARA